MAEEEVRGYVAADALGEPLLTAQQADDVGTRVRNGASKADRERRRVKEEVREAVRDARRRRVAYSGDDAETAVARPVAKALAAPYDLKLPGAKVDAKPKRKSEMSPAERLSVKRIQWEREMDQESEAVAAAAMARWDAENPELAAQAKAAEAAEAARAAEAAAEAAPEVWEWDDQSPFDLQMEVETMVCAVALHEAGFVRCVRCAHVLLQQAQELNQQLPSVKTLELLREYLDAWQRSLVLRDTLFTLIEAEAWLDAVTARPLCTACTACGGSVLTAAGTSATMQAAAALCEANRIVDLQDIRKSIVM